METKQREAGELIYPKLSYKLVGLAFDVHNELGGGLREKAYENAFKLAMERENMEYSNQINIPIKYNGEKVGDRFLDFLVENRVVLELKSGNRFSRANIEQVNEYLKNSKLKLGILINFGTDEVKFKRIVNLN